MTAESIPPHQLVPGQRYRISIRDCCVSANLTATFVELRDRGFSDHSGDPVTDFGAAVFDIGEFDENYGWHAYPDETELEAL